jgi:hypothetical protein
MEELLLAALKADAGVAGIVGEQIEWGRRGGLPAIALHRTWTAPHYHMKGRLRLSEHTVQIDCWAAARIDASKLGRLVLAASDPLKSAALQVMVETIRDGSELSDGPPAEDANAFYRTSLDVRVWTLAS